MTTYQYPEDVLAEFRAFAGRAIEDDELLNSLIGNFMATLCEETPKLAAYQERLAFDRVADEVRRWWAKYRDCPDPRWWPRIVAQCIWLFKVWEGRMPRGEPFDPIVQRYLDCTEEEAHGLVRFSGCNSPRADRYFHSLWVEMVSEGPGLKDKLKDAGLL